MPAITVSGLTFVYSSQSGLFQEIHVADSISELSAQDLLNAARLAESSELGVGFGAIANASGKESLGGSIQRGFVVSLLDDWRVFSLKPFGTFTLIDVIKPDGSSPFVPNASVSYTLRLAVNSTIAAVSGGGGGGATAAEIWNYAGGRSLTQVGVEAIAAAAADATDNQLEPRFVPLAREATLNDTRELLGFVPGQPLTATETAHTTPSGKRLLVSIDPVTGQTVITRSDLP